MWLVGFFDINRLQSSGNTSEQQELLNNYYTGRSACSTRLFSTAATANDRGSAAFRIIVVRTHCADVPVSKAHAHREFCVSVKPKLR
jgi:hypothetical protein